jgi:DNA-binding MarR family transcriptional regulator
MADQRLSQLQRRILAWLVAEDQRMRGTMAADHRDLARALAHHKGNLSSSLRNLAAKGLVMLTKTPGGQIAAVDLTRAGRARAELLDNGLNKGKPVFLVCARLAIEEYADLQEYAGRELRTPGMQIRVLVREYIDRCRRAEVSKARA